MPHRPNILFLMSDEHRADVTGYEGNRIIRTPVLDELARSGVAFRNAYTPSPSCIPARQCLMSGQLPRTCGCEGWIDLRPNHLTFPRHFSRYAYQTVACGKLHHIGTDQLQGWTRRVGGDVVLAADCIEHRQAEEFARYSRSGDFKWSDAREVQRAGIGRGPYQRFDEYAVEGALNFIEDYLLSPFYDREMHHLPLMLKVSLIQPHYPYFTDQRRFNYYLNRVEPYLEQPVSDHPALGRRPVRPGIDVSPREMRRATAAYYGMIETVDEHFGRVMQALADGGQDLDDWIIIYTSDHGEMLGEHGVWWKSRFYDASVRVPLIIRWPRGFAGGRVVQQNVNLCDLFATLCELAGLPVPGGLDSRSLVPLLRGRGEDWNDETISQFQRDHVMIKRGHLKYQFYGPQVPEVLFDLERNPQETVNYLDDPAYAGAVAGFRRRLAELGHAAPPVTAPARAGSVASGRSRSSSGSSG